MAKLSSGTLEAIRNFGRGGGMLTGSGQGLAPVDPMMQLGRSGGNAFKEMLGGLTGRDFRNPKQIFNDELKDAETMEERIQAEIKYRSAVGDIEGSVVAATRLREIKNQKAEDRIKTDIASIEKPMTVEGMQQRAMLLAKSSDPKNISLAKSLLDQSSIMLKSEEENKKNKNIRRANTAFLEKNYPEFSKDYENYALSNKGVDSLRTRFLEEKSAEAKASVGKTSKRKAFVSLAENTYNLPQETIDDIKEGEYDSLDLSSFKETFKPEKIKANNKNFVVFRDPESGEAGGTFIKSYREREDGKLWDPADQKWVTQKELNIARVAGTGEEREKSKDKDKIGIKETLLARSEGATLRLAKNLSNMGPGSRLRAQFLATSPRLRAGIAVGGGEELAEKSAAIQDASEIITETVARILSGAAIKDDEREKFTEILVPTTSDFPLPEAIFNKLANVYVGLRIANRNGFKTEGPEVNPEENSEILRNALAEIAEKPITAEIKELIQEGNFEEALKIRMDQLFPEETNAEKLVREMRERANRINN